MIFDISLGLLSCLWWCLERRNTCSDELLNQFTEIQRQSYLCIRLIVLHWLSNTWCDATTLQRHPDQ